MSISHWSGDRRLERYASLKYYNVEKQKSRFTLGLDAAENTHCIKKGSNKCGLELNFVQKSLQAHMSIYPQSGARGLERYLFFKYYNVEKWKSRFTLGLNVPKRCIASKKGSNK